MKEVSGCGRVYVKKNVEMSDIITPRDAARSKHINIFNTSII